jgi:hypothetical protein
VKSAAYTSMVRPTMEYASSVWDPTNRKKLGGRHVTLFGKKKSSKNDF